MTVTNSVLGKVLALALLMCVLSPLVLIGASGWQRFQENAEEITTRQQIFDRLRGIAEFQKNMPVEAAPNLQLDLLLGAGPPAVLSAGLQARLRELAEGLGVEIQQVSELAAKPSDRFLEVGIHLEMSGPQQGVHQLLKQLDLNVPWLFTRNLQLRSGFVDDPEPQIEPPFYVGMDVWGLAPVQPGAKP